MKVFAALFDPATGARHTVEDDTGPGPEGVEGADYMWTEGNFACDCNRRLFLARAGVAGYTDDEHAGPCGDTIKLERLWLENGTVLVAGPRQGEKG